MTYTPPIKNQKSAFGELLTAEDTPVVQLNFNYNVNTELTETSNNNGTTTIVDNILKCSTGTAANQSALLNSRVAIKYGSGQGVHFRASAIFTAGVTGSNQLVGAGDSGNGLFFGYQGDTFGVMRRYGGLPEVRLFTVDTASTTTENIAVTLDGVSTGTVIPVTNSGNMTTTANEIAAYDYSGIGRGWSAYAEGDEIKFISYDSSPRTGTYSITATTAAVTVTRPITGVTPTESFVAQTSWSEDKGDGTGELPVMDWTKGNVFQVRFQWLGFGLIGFWVEKPDTGEYVLVHQIEYANTYTTPSLANPNLQLCAFVENVANTSDIVMNVGSMGGFIEGKTNGAHFHNGVENSVNVGTTETPVLTIHNKRLYNDKINKIRIKLIYTSVVTDGTKNVIFRYKTNPTLTNASFAEVEPGLSIIELDTSATIVSGGDEQLTIGKSKVDSGELDLSTASFFMDPGGFFTITAQTTGGTSDVTASVNWEELF